MIPLLLLAAAAMPDCAPVSGSRALLDDRRTQYLFVGEQHGTNEAPALFADLVCQASLDRPVVVAIEQRTTEQAAIDAYVGSDGGAVARAKFLQSAIWTNAFQDGRGSKAMWAMIDRLRAMKRTHRIVRVAAFQPVIEFREGVRVDALVNEGMAAILRKLASTDPHILVMVLTGSVHASKGPVDFGGGAIVPAAARLPADTTRSVLVEGNGGMAWNCTDTCGPHSSPSAKTERRHVEMTSRPLLPGAQQGGAFDATLYTGVSDTASPPAISAR